MPRLLSREGSTLPLVALLLVGFLGVAALAIDVGFLYSVRTKLQATADATALAAVQETPNTTAARSVARQYVSLNEGEDLLSDFDVVLGSWNDLFGVFTPNGSPTNAVQVTVPRTAAAGNPVGLWFARVLGIQEADVNAVAIAARGATGSRFLIDDEMIDSDVPAIEQLASSYGKTPEQIISDGNGDWFIDLPPGTVIELPTGQVGDEGMFDFGHEEFPFGRDTDPTLVDFLNYNEDGGSWRYNTVPKSMLDPLVGVSRVNDGDEYASYVSGATDACQVSPVYKSDISALNPVNGAPAVNALGWRRGLLAFKILAVGSDPDGPSGSVLPNLVIEVCPPVPIDDLIKAGQLGGKIHLVR